MSIIHTQSTRKIRELFNSSIVPEDSIFVTQIDRTGHAVRYVFLVPLTQEEKDERQTS